MMKEKMVWKQFDGWVTSQIFSSDCGSLPNDQMTKWPSDVITVSFVSTPRSGEEIWGEEEEGPQGEVGAALRRGGTTGQRTNGGLGEAVCLHQRGRPSRGAAWAGAHGGGGEGRWVRGAAGKYDIMMTKIMAFTEVQELKPHSYTKKKNIIKKGTSSSWVHFSFSPIMKFVILFFFS